MIEEFDDIHPVNTEKYPILVNIIRTSSTEYAPFTSINEAVVWLFQNLTAVDQVESITIEKVAKS